MVILQYVVVTLNYCGSYFAQQLWIINTVVGFHACVELHLHYCGGYFALLWLLLCTTMVVNLHNRFE